MPSSSLRRAELSPRRIHQARSEGLEDRRLFSAIAMFFDPAYVNTAAGSDSTDLYQQIIYAGGNTVTKFTGIDATSVSNALAGKQILLIPALDEGDLNGAMSNVAKADIKAFVDGGGGLLVVGDPSLRNTAFLQNVFNYSAITGPYNDAQNDYPLVTAAATGTAFVHGPATIGLNAGREDLDTNTLPASAKKVYHETVPFSDDTAVALLPDVVGSATTFPIAYLSYDWTSGGPNGTQNSGWNAVLDLAIDQLAGVQNPVSMVLTGPAGQSATAGQSTSFTLGSLTERYAVPPYSVDVNWGDGSAHTTINLAAAGTIPAASHTYASSGGFTVTEKVTDSDSDSSNTVTFLATVRAAPSVTVTAPAAQSATEGVSKSFTLGSFAQTSTTGPYAVSVNWGDGSAATTFTAAAAGTLAAQSHAFAAAGSRTVTVTVTDSTGAVHGSSTFAVAVAGPTITVTPPAAITASVGTGKSFALGSFTSAGGTAPFTAVVNWGDGSATTTVAGLAAGTIPAQAHTYQVAGSETATVTVTDASGQAVGTSTFAVTVSAGSTASSVTVLPSLTTVRSAGSVTLTATVLPATATGLVTFEQGTTLIGTATVGTGGIATLVTTALVTAGTAEVTALYGGSATLAPSTSAPVAITVLPAVVVPTVTVTVSNTSVSSSDSVTLTATVSPATSGGVAVTGTITFYQGTIVLGTAPIGAGGVATLVTSAVLIVGTTPVSAIFGGDANFQPGTSPVVDIVVVPTATTTALSLSSAFKTLAQAVTMTATVRPAAAAATTLADAGVTGTVTFSVGVTTIGTAPVGPDGVATLVVTGEVPTGTGDVVATYGGDAAFLPSTSAASAINETTHALVPVVRKVVLPPTVIGGQPIHANVAVGLTNQLTGVQSGPEIGTYQIQIYASVSTVLDVTTDVVIATFARAAKILPGKTIHVTVPVTSLPPTLASGTYHILVVTTDRVGYSEQVDTGQTITVTAPVLSLSATFTSVSAANLKRGATLSLTATGNTSEVTRLTAVVGLSTDAAGLNVVASGTGAVQPAKATIRVGRATKLKVTGWTSLLAGLPSGTYFLTVTLTDALGNAATAVSTTTVQK